MADVEINISTNVIAYQTWLRTSLIGLGITDGDGNPLITSTELGPDQVDAFENFIEESTREVNKLFISRQGDTAGVPFEYDGTTVVYRFNECEPVLNQSASIKSVMNEDVKNALFAHITMLWFKLKGDGDNASLLANKFAKLSVDIQNNLYRLHD